jgi:hypothetical protein
MRLFIPAAIVAGLILFALLVAAVSDGGRRQGTAGDPLTSTNVKRDVVKAAQRAVRDILKAPSTAKFPSYNFELDHYFIEQLGTNTYRVKSHVDAQNSFGAMLRNEFSVIVTTDGSVWYGKEPMLY